MEKVGEDIGRKRKMKFEVVELEVLVEEVKKHSDTLQQPNLNFTRRNAIWEAIGQKVNAVGKTYRTTDEVKRRWQDMRRRTKETMYLNKSIRKKEAAKKEKKQAVEEKPVPKYEQQTLLTICKEDTEIQGYDSLKVEPEEEEPPEVCQSPPHSSTQSPPHFSPLPPPSSTQPPPPPTAEPRSRPSLEDIDVELLQQQTRQTAALEDGLQSIAHEVRAASTVSRAVRRNSQAIVAHSRQLVTAVTGLTTAINALVKVIGDGIQAIGGSIDPSGLSNVQPGNGEQSDSPCDTQQSNPRKRKTPEDILM